MPEIIYYQEVKLQRTDTGAVVEAWIGTDADGKRYISWDEGEEWSPVTHIRRKDLDDAVEEADRFVRSMRHETTD